MFLEPARIPNKHELRPRQIGYVTLGDTSRGKRIWLEGLRLPDIGFEAGAKFTTGYDEQLGIITLDLDDNGTHTVSSRKRRGAASAERTPIIDINNASLDDLFGDYRKGRVLYYPSRIVVQVHPQEYNRVTAFKDFEINAASGYLTTASICVGGGMSTHMMKSGLALAGYKTCSEWVIDVEKKYLQSAIDNTGAINDDTTIVHSALGDVEPELLSPVNILQITLPCTGASVAGRAKNQIKDPESHKTACTTILKAIEIIEKLMPPVIVNENVIPWASSASASLFAGRLKELGYKIETMNADSYGALEDRKRSITVASHESINLPMSEIVPVLKREDSIEAILDDIPVDDPMWKSYDYLKAKEERDRKAGKGFRQQLLTGKEDAVGVFGRGYNKVRSTEPRLLHPLNPELSRLFTVNEVARMQKNDPDLVAKLPAGTAYEILGQGVSGGLFMSLGAWMGQRIQEEFVPDPYADIKHQMLIG